MAGEVKGAGIDKLWARRKIQALTDSLREGVDRAIHDKGCLAPPADVLAEAGEYLRQFGAAPSKH